MGCEVDSIDYQGIADPTERVLKLLRECAHIEDKLFLVGSSMGGHVATAAAAELGAAGLFVLAPAYYVEGYETLTPAASKIPTCIVHGWHDEIVPVENSIRFASECFATLHLVDGDHRLTENLDEIVEYLQQFITRN
jgi:predicted esterase